MSTAKPFVISKDRVVKAFELVKANAGSAGVDEQSLEKFGEHLKANLYKIWNRMSSGSYFPPPVKAVEIPKRSGGTRVLGVPTVADRVAQMVVKLVSSHLWSPSFCLIHLDTDRVDPLWTPSESRGSAAGNSIGSWSLTSRVCLTTFDTICCRRQYVIIQTVVGYFCTSKDGWSRPFECQTEAKSQEKKAFRKVVWSAPYCRICFFIIRSMLG